MRACAKVIVLSLVWGCVDKPEFGPLDAALATEGDALEAGDSASRARPAYAGTAAPAAGRAAWASTPIGSATGGAAAATAGVSGGMMRVADAAVATADAAAAPRPVDAAVAWSADASTPKPPADAGVAAAPLADAGANTSDAARDAAAAHDAGVAGAAATPTAGRSGSAPDPDPDPQDSPPLPAAGAGEPPLPPRIAAPSRAGQLVITEIMIDPKTLSDTDGEWFELQNVSGSAFDLQGCDIDDGGKDLRPIAASTVVEPHAFVTVARRDSPGFVPSYVASISFTNGADTLALRCGGVDIDRVSYDKANGFPLVAGASLALDPSKTRADANDDPGAWCAARDSYGPELGTPGASNPSCDNDDAGVDGP